MLGRMIFQATLMIAFFNLLSRLLGLVREIVIARQFGATSATDAYLVALTIPLLFFAILSQALASVVVPVFTEYSARGEKRQAWRLSANLFNILFILLTGAALIGIVIAPVLVKLVAPGLPESTAGLAASLTRIMLPMLVFAGMATLFTGFLNANNIFGISAFSGAVNNGVIIASALTLGAVFGIKGLAWGTVGGMLASVVVQVPALRRTGFRFLPELNWRYPGVLKVFNLVLPVTIGITISQAFIVVDRILASGLPVGSISALNFGQKLIQLPVSLFVLALSTAVFPTLSTWVAEKRNDDVLDAMRRALRIIVLLTLPAAVGLIVLRGPIVRLLFERGAFDERATAMTAVAVLFYAVGLVGFAANIILTRAFYAFQDTRTPVKLLAVNLVINIILSIILMRPLLHGGLALGSSISVLVNTALLVHYLNKRLPGIWDPSWWSFGLKVMVASALLGIVTFAADSFFVDVFAPVPGTLGLLLRVGSGILTGVTVYTLACIVLRFEEVGFVWRNILRLVKR